MIKNMRDLWYEFFMQSFVFLNNIQILVDVNVL